MATKKVPETAWRTSPMYSFGEAARLVGVSPVTVRHWILGSSSSGEARPPLPGVRQDQTNRVSFLQLIELVVAATLRKAEGASFRAVRNAYFNAQEQFGYAYPFAHSNLEAVGRHVVHSIHSANSPTSFHALNEPDQWILPGLRAVSDVAAQIDYEDELAVRWWPLGKRSCIVVDPHIVAGRPAIAGRRVTADVIYARLHKAKESVDFIMQDFQLEREQVEAALEYCERLAA